MRLRRALWILPGIYLAASVAVGIVAAEIALRPPRKPAAGGSLTVGAVEDVAIRAADAVELRAWFTEPPYRSGSAVILLHGVADNRDGVASHARLFLPRGYSVLLPNARAHGGERRRDRRLRRLGSLGRAPVG